MRTYPFPFPPSFDSNRMDGRNNLHIDTTPILLSCFLRVEERQLLSCRYVSLLLGRESYFSVLLVSLSRLERTKKDRFHVDAAPPLLFLASSSRGESKTREIPCPLCRHNIFFSFPVFSSRWEEAKNKCGSISRSDTPLRFVHVEVANEAE